MSAIPSWAVKGRKVACRTVEGWMDGIGPVTAPSVGDVLTIRETLIIGRYAALRFVEIVNDVRYRPHMGCSAEYAFGIEHFRPLVTLEDDMEAHFSVLLDVKQPSPVEA